MKKISFLLTIVFTALLSCNKDLPDPGGTNAQRLSGEWWVALYNPDGTLAYPADYRGHLYTYNTAANANEIWIDDDYDPAGNTLWDFKVKAQADLNNLTFSANQVKSVVAGYDIKVNITDGKVFPLGGKSKSGVTVDSIYMKVEFEDDPGVIYTIRGHQRSGFREDEYQ